MSEGKKDGTEEQAESNEDTFLSSAWRAIHKEPAKAAALAYFWIIAIGYARTFGNTMHFGINLVDLASPSDYLLAGVRDPIVVLLAALTGAIIYNLWRRARTRPQTRLVLWGVVFASLTVSVFGSATYRHAVVKGAWRDTFFAPMNLSVRLSSEKGEPEGKLQAARIVAVTAEFFVFYISSSENEGEVRVVRRSIVRELSRQLP